MYYNLKNPSVRCQYIWSLANVHIVRIWQNKISWYLCNMENSTQRILISWSLALVEKIEEDESENWAEKSLKKYEWDSSPHLFIHLFILYLTWWF